MKSIHILFFASLREELGMSTLALQTTAASVAELRTELSQRSPAFANALSKQKAVRAAVNQVMVAEEAPLWDASEVAFFPPVTGG